MKHLVYGMLLMALIGCSGSGGDEIGTEYEYEMCEDQGGEVTFGGDGPVCEYQSVDQQICEDQDGYWVNGACQFYKPGDKAQCKVNSESCPYVDE